MKRKLDRPYLHDLDAFVDRIFAEADARGIRIDQLARRAGLHFRTVWRINVRATRLPYLRTAMRLASAVGLSLEPTAAVEPAKPKRRRKAS
jgi:lambda repressor-like predicted transcriptional regulator